METYTEREEEAGETQQQQQETEGSCECVKEESEGKKGVRIKVVLTKEELQWLMLRLKENEGVGVEQVLQEIQRSREKVEAWKPSLESILEIPEVPDMER